MEFAVGTFRQDADAGRGAHQTVERFGLGVDFRGKLRSRFRAGLEQIRDSQARQSRDSAGDHIAAENLHQAYVGRRTSLGLGCHSLYSTTEKDFVDYPDSVQFLYTLGNEIKTAKLGLGRIRTVLKALGDPQQSFRSVHVAGTNGKGSTCAMIESGLREAGARTGLFTSPHLIEPTERIQVNGIPVSRAQFQRAFEVVHETAGKLDLDCHPTYFETVTAMGFWLFRELEVESAVIETGLGGRLDATNVIEPVLTVITPIDFDHEAYLGHTIEAIAGEKAGILKAGVPAVFARQRPEASAVLEARARELGLRVARAEDYEIRDLQIDARGSKFNGLTCPLD
jgi:dihydrofolate synthase / folylpolyglutamate synthase